MIFHRHLLIAAAALLATSCATSPKTASNEVRARDSYWAELSALCGQTLYGKMVSNEAVDGDMAGRPMRMTVASCSDSEIRIPFHVGPLEEGGNWDTSRTWVMRKTARGIQLKHDHRHEDGTPDAVTNYGGESVTPAYRTPQGLGVRSFPVDNESIANFRANGLDKSETNVWEIGIQIDKEYHPNAPVFVYRLKRTGEHARHFEVAFY